MYRVEDCSNFAAAALRIAAAALMSFIFGWGESLCRETL